MTVAPRLDAERAAIAGACRMLAARGLVIGTAGNLSVRRGNLVAVTATGAQFETLSRRDVSVVDPSGKVVAGGLEPTSEIGLHLGIYERSDAAAVVHTHPPMATAVGLLVDELPCIHYQMLTLGGAVPVAPYATFGSAELAELTLTALTGKSAALMANHGAITHGSSLDEALERTLLLEWACAVYLRARPLGEPRVLDQAAQEAVIMAALSTSYGTTRPTPPENP